MTVWASSWNAQGEVAQQRRAAMLARIEGMRALEDRAAQASARSRPVFEKRGQLLPRERVALLLDPGTPYLPLCALAGFLQDTKDPALSVPGGGMIAGIGFVSGVRCMVVASDSGIDAGAIQPMGLDKILRVQEIALQNRLPFVHLVESAGANLMKYRVEGFVHGGALFRNLARLSAAALAARQQARADKASGVADAAATAVDAPPHGVSHQDEGSEASAARSRQSLMDTVPNSRRIIALIVIFIIVIVFWMVFHQNGSTLTYWADDNTDWNVTGTISNSINAFWVLALTFPLVWFWGFLDRRGKEPATPTKMAFGMTLTGLSFLVLYLGASFGESAPKSQAQFSTGAFRVNERVITNLGTAGVPKDVLDKIVAAKAADGKNTIFGVKFEPKTDEATNVTTSGEQQLVAAINAVAPGQGDAHKAAILQNAYLFRVSAFWLIIAYGIVTLGELMLSPMGLSLVSKVAPISVRGLMMGGWFVATAIGNKLTQIGIFWDIWLQSTFFLVLALMALFMAVVLFFLLKPLKKAMPGV